jgi:predicted pore-forming effector associated with SMODS systems
MSMSTQDVGSMYTQDVGYRMRTVLFLLSVLSILLAWAVHRAMPAYPSVIAPVTLAFFGVLFWLFDSLLWKFPVIRLLNYCTPNFAGDWEGSLSRQVGERTEQLEVKLRIRQTWSKLSLVLQTSEAVSRNTLAGLRLADPDAIVLTWLYKKDGTDAPSLLEPGRGIIELTLHRKGHEASLAGAVMSGEFIESKPGEPLEVVFKKPGPFYWNPVPF